MSQPPYRPPPPDRHQSHDRPAHYSDQSGGRGGYGSGGRGGYQGGRPDARPPYEGAFDDRRGGRYDDRLRDGLRWEADDRRPGYEHGPASQDNYARAPPPGRDQPHFAPTHSNQQAPDLNQPWSHHPQPQSPFHHQHHQQAYSNTPLPQAGQPHPGAPPHRANATPNPPSASVVLLGLPPLAQDLHLRHFLEDLGASIDSTTVIIDRATGLSKRYGFAKFASVEHARAFVEPNFPSVVWKERGKQGMGQDDGMIIKINYSQKSGGWREDQGAGARMVEDERKAEASAAPESYYVNDGTRDIGSTPSQIILMRQLDPLATEHDIITALGSIPSRVGDDIRLRSAVKRVLVVKDRASRSSWGFAFVQLQDVKLATELLGQVMNPRVFPQGFKIRGAIGTVSFSHENSFVPIYAKSDWSFRGEGGQQLAYWDDKAFVAVWVPPASTPGTRAGTPVASTSPAQKGGPGPGAVTFKSGSADVDGDGDADADMDAFFSSLDAEIPELVEEGGVPGPGERSAAAGPTILSVPVAGPSAPKPIVIKSLAGTGTEERIKAMATAPELAVKTAIKAVEPIAVLGKREKTGDLIVSRKAAPNISKWNQKAQELKAPAAPPAPPAADLSSANATPTSSTSLTAGPSTTSNTVGTRSSEEEDHLPHGDLVTKVCLLCQRQFKTLAELEKHNRLSALHKTNLADPKAVAACATRKAAALAKQAPHPSASTSTSASPAPAVPDPNPSSAFEAPKYVDRAAARREAFGQPDGPQQAAKRRKKFDGPAPPPPPPVGRTASEEIEEGNKGRGMLEKMGWSKGVGLGATGEGRVAPVEASQFQKGAGLGATKGVVVGTYQEGPKGYGESLRDKARERMREAEGGGA